MEFVCSIFCVFSLTSVLYFKKPIATVHLLSRKRTTIKRIRIKTEKRESRPVLLDEMNKIVIFSSFFFFFFFSSCFCSSSPGEV